MLLLLSLPVWVLFLETLVIEGSSTRFSESHASAIMPLNCVDIISGEKSQNLVIFRAGCITILSLWALTCWQHHEVVAKMIGIFPAHILGKSLLTLSYIPSDAMHTYSPTMTLNDDPQNKEMRTGCKLNEHTKAGLLSSQFYNHRESQCGL